jgi:hypothetical protein
MNEPYLTSLTLVKKSISKEFKNLITLATLMTEVNSQIQVH